MVDEQWICISCEIGIASDMIQAHWCKKSEPSRGMISYNRRWNSTTIVLQNVFCTQIYKLLIQCILMSVNINSNEYRECWNALTFFKIYHICRILNVWCRFRLRLTPKSHIEILVGQFQSIPIWKISCDYLNKSTPQDLWNTSIYTRTYIIHSKLRRFNSISIIHHLLK